MTLSRAWGTWLLVGQYVNFALALLLAFGSGTSELAWLQAWRGHALELHGTVSAVFASLQAIARSLTDANGNGVPDILETPVAPTEGA